MKFLKYPKIKTLGVTETEGVFNGMVVVQSKIDGANFQFFLDDTGLMFGSRNRSFGVYSESTSNSWIAMKPILAAYGANPKLFNPNYIYYGESMQKHTIEYNDIPDFVGYDVYDGEAEAFLNWKDAKKEFELLGLPFIHVHFEKHGSEITIDELEECIKNSPYRNGDDEGVTIKNYDELNVYDRPLFAKIVTDNFKEKNREVFKGSYQPKKVTDSTILIAETYGTDARIEKIIHKLVDEGNNFDMSMMPILFNAVAEDIFEENAVEIFHSFKDINFKHLSGIIAKKSAIVLKRILIERVL